MAAREQCLLVVEQFSEVYVYTFPAGLILRFMSNICQEVPSEISQTSVGLLDLTNLIEGAGGRADLQNQNKQNAKILKNTDKRLF